jgi:predicted CXXCH cytochrome family protein
MLAALLLVSAAAGQEQKNACLACHAQLSEKLEVKPDVYAVDIHAQKGLSCVSCHGGDAAREDPEKSMSAAAGFKRGLSRRQIPEMCGKCHGDAGYMRSFNPSMRTDQLNQYRSSMHGKRLAGGDKKVAVCTDCHSVHDIRSPRDSRSAVHPTNVAQTCARCHADAGRMKGYKIPTDQFASYAASVHHDALAVRGDLSAPTCNTCHGNHGAAPPGVATVENVCSTCHVFQAQLFDTSPHKAAFSALGIAACITCHSNHRIQRPSDAFLGTKPDAVCTKCHSDGDPGYKTAGAMRAALQKLEDSIQRSNEILERAERSGMEVSQAKLDQAEAHDALTKARVTIHAFQLDRLNQGIDAGLKVAEKTYVAGQHALDERDYRRKGLAFSLVTIALVLVGLRMLIQQLESRKNNHKETV